MLPPGRASTILTAGALLSAGLACAGFGLRPPCPEREEVQLYLARVHERVIERWDPPGLPPGAIAVVSIRFTLARDGSVESAEAERNEDPKLWRSALTAMQWAQPFGELSGAKACLKGRELRATFRKHVAPRRGP